MLNTVYKLEVLHKHLVWSTKPCLSHKLSGATLRWIQGEFPYRRPMTNTKPNPKPNTYGKHCMSNTDLGRTLWQGVYPKHTLSRTPCRTPLTVMVNTPDLMFGWWVEHETGFSAFWSNFRSVKQRRYGEEWKSEMVWQVGEGGPLSKIKARST